MKKLALGTVQFGVPYGIANKAGQVSSLEARRIIEKAHCAGFGTLDTAAGYGESESVLGSIGIDNWRVVSKLPKLPENIADAQAWVRESFEESVRRLKQKKLYGYLLHSPDDLLGERGKEIFASVQDLKEAGFIEKTGYSVYSPEQLDLIWHNFPPDLVQIPFNIIDRRMQTTGWLDTMHKAGVEIHSRSAFLQGLLLMNAQSRPRKFNKWSGLWLQWHEWLREQNISPLQACLSYVMSQPEINQVVIGVEGTKQLEEIILTDKSKNILLPETFSSADADLINPSRWALL